MLVQAYTPGLEQQNAGAGLYTPDLEQQNAGAGVYTWLEQQNAWCWRLLRTS